MSAAFQRSIIAFVTAVTALIATSGWAQSTKVVVVPIGGDEPAPSFRIVPAGSTTEANRGRLEYTNDRNPTPQSDWGTVCDDCFSSVSAGCTTLANPNAAAHAICKDLGFVTGFSDTSFASSGSLDFTLDNVICPENADSFKDCNADTSFHNCTAPEQAGVDCKNFRLVFVTDSIYDGDLVSAANSNLGTAFTDAQGLQAADALCQAEATAANLPGSYKAWLSNSNGSPVSRFVRSKVQYVLADQVTVVADDFANLTSGAIQNHINLNAFGNAVSTSPPSVWSGTSANGNAFGDNCSDWSSNTVGGVFGAQGQYIFLLSAWSRNGAGASCGLQSRFYCFQQ